MAALTALALMMGCGGGSVNREPLRALEGDPMAAYVPPGGSVLRDDRLDERSGGGLDKPRPATLRRSLSLPPDGAAGAVPAAAAAARDAGWKVGAPAGDGVTARRRIGDRDATLVVTLVRNPALVPEGRVPALSVELEALR